jgi:hypothetical protein
MNQVNKLTSTTDLFWTQHHLLEFQAAWDNVAEYEYEHTWITRIYQQGVNFSNSRTEQAVDKDIEKLFAAARSGCNLTLHRTYYQIWWKWTVRTSKEAEKAADYISNAWDFISTAQCGLARRWGAYIEWHFDDIEELA